MNLRYLLALFAAFFLCCSARSQQSDLAGGYNYQNSDPGNSVRTSLNGWYVSGQYDPNDHFALTLEADNYHGAVAGEKERQQNFVFGPQYTFLEMKRRPGPSSICRQAISVPRPATRWNMPSIFSSEEGCR